MSEDHNTGHQSNDVSSTHSTFPSSPSSPLNPKHCIVCHFYSLVVLSVMRQSRKKRLASTVDDGDTRTKRRAIAGRNVIDSGPAVVRDALPLDSNLPASRPPERGRDHALRPPSRPLAPITASEVIDICDSESDSSPSSKRHYTKPVPSSSRTRPGPISKIRTVLRSSSRIIEISDSSDEELGKRAAPATVKLGDQQGRQQRTRADKGKGRASRETGTLLDDEEVAHHNLVPGRPEEDWIKKWKPRFEELRTAADVAISLLSGVEIAIGSSVGEGAEEKEEQEAVSGLTEGLRHTDLDDNAHRREDEGPLSGGLSEVKGTGDTAHPSHAARPVIPLWTAPPSGDLDADAMVVDTPEPQWDIDAAVAAVLQIVPGLEPAYLEDLIKVHALEHGTQAIEAVLQQIFDETQADAWVGQGKRNHSNKDLDIRTTFVSPVEIGSGDRNRRGGHSVGSLDVHEGEDITSVECLVCYERISTTLTIQCDKAHHFCLACLEHYATVQLGEQKPRLRCMQDCDSFFNPGDLRRVLPDQLFSLFEKLNQRLELQAADLQNFEECPFCSWGCVMEVSLDESSVFQCHNFGVCGRISCRLCRLEQHLHQPCEEVDTGKLERHAIEEAMSRAVIRKCPNCPQVAFVKEAGCNKMVCPECSAFSCYICKTQIGGYEHFSPHDPVSRCPLFDNVEERHAQEVNEAYVQATYRPA